MGLLSWIGRISYVKLVKLYYQGKDSFVILVRLARLEKLYEFGQVGYVSKVKLVKFGRLG